jgi:hypothetical protein
VATNTYRAESAVVDRGIPLSMLGKLQTVRVAPISVESLFGDLR